jgi:hypothetical protein
MDEHADVTPPADQAPPAGETPGPEEGGAGQEHPGPDPAAVRDTIDRLIAAGIGAVGVTADRAESLLGASGGAQRLGERATSAISGMLDDLGLVKRERFDELELKVAQLEHRIRLLEEGASGGAPSPGPRES